MTVKLSFHGRTFLRLHALWPALAILHTGMAFFIRKEVHGRYGFKYYEEVPVWHTMGPTHTFTARSDADGQRA